MPGGDGAEQGAGEAHHQEGVERSLLALHEVKGELLDGKGIKEHAIGKVTEMTKPVDKGESHIGDVNDAIEQGGVPEQCSPEFT